MVGFRAAATCKPPWRRSPWQTPPKGQGSRCRLWDPVLPTWAACLQVGAPPQFLTSSCPDLAGCTPCCFDSGPLQLCQADIATAHRSAIGPLQVGTGEADWAGLLVDGQGVHVVMERFNTPETRWRFQAMHPRCISDSSLSMTVSESLRECTDHIWVRAVTNEC